MDISLSKYEIEIILDAMLDQSRHTKDQCYQDNLLILIDEIEKQTDEQ